MPTGSIDYIQLLTVPRGDASLKAGNACTREVARPIFVSAVGLLKYKIHEMSISAGYSFRT